MFIKFLPYLLISNVNSTEPLVIILKDSSLVLDNYQDEICQFVTDESYEVRCTTLRFIFYAIRMDSDSLTALSATIIDLLNDTFFRVVRTTLIETIKMVGRLQQRDKIEMPVKEALMQIMIAIHTLLSHDNDGIRTQALRTVEAFCYLPSDCRAINEYALSSIKDFLKLSHITSGNIITGLYSLYRLTKSDPSNIAFLVSQYELIHSNLPPTLSVTQVKNVRKIVKIQLLDVLRNVSGVQIHHQSIFQLLSDLGVSKKDFEAAINISTGKSEKRKKRTQEMDGAPSSKKSKSEKAVGLGDKDRIDQLSIKIKSELNIDNVIELVIKSMRMLPNNMPTQFSATYTPIQSAGTEPQKEHLARMLANQMIAAGLLGSTANEIPEISSSQSSDTRLSYGVKSNVQKPITSKPSKPIITKTEPEPERLFIILIDLHLFTYIL